jgi:hypothetical protein
MSIQREVESSPISVRVLVLVTLLLGAADLRRAELPGGGVIENEHSTSIESISRVRAPD